MVSSTSSLKSPPAVEPTTTGAVGVDQSRRLPDEKQQVFVPSGAALGTPFDSMQDIDELLPGPPDAWIQSDTNLPMRQDWYAAQTAATSEPLLAGADILPSVGVASIISGGTATYGAEQPARRAHFMPTPPSSLADMLNNSNPPSQTNSHLNVPNAQTPHTSNGYLIGERDHKESFTEKDHHATVQNMYKKTRRRHFTDPVDFEGILNIIGGCSWWQIWVYLLISLQQIPHAMFNLSVVYMMYQPDHWCQVPGFDMDQTKLHTVNWNWTEADVLDSEMLYKKEFNQARNKHWHSQCKYIDRPENVYHELVHKTFAEAMDFIKYNKTDNEVECSHWKYNTSVMTDTIVTEWDLVCSNSMKRAHAHLAYSVGFLVGCLLSGFSSDRFGRKPTVIGFGVLSSMFGLILPYSTYFPMFLLLRFLGAICNEAADLAAYVLCMEITGTKYRAMVGSLLQAPWACGYALLALIAYLTRSWRSIQLVTAALHTGAVLLVCVLPESPRWLIVNNRVRESEEIIRRACRMNNSYLPADLELVKHAEQRKWVGRNERANIFHLLKSRELLFRTLNIFVIWIATALVYYGLVIALSDQSAPDRALFAGNFFVNNAIAGAIELPTLLMCVLLLRWGRKRSQMITLIGAGVFIICGMFAVNESLNEYALGFFMMGKVCIQAAFNILYIFTSEMYPTVVRNSAVGVASMVARIGSGTSSYVAILSDVTLPVVPMIIFSVFSLVAGMLVLLLPETRDQPLPDTLQDAVTFLKNDPTSYHCARPPLSKQQSNSSATSPPPTQSNTRTPKSILTHKHQPPSLPTTIIEESASEIPPPSPLDAKKKSFQMPPVPPTVPEETVSNATNNSLDNCTATILDSKKRGSVTSGGSDNLRYRNQAVGGGMTANTTGKSDSKTSLIATPNSDETDYAVGKVNGVDKQ